MTFSEFLIANGDKNLADFLENVNSIEPLPDAFFNPLYEKLKMYYVTGGMPEPVLMWTKARDVSAMQESLSDIISAENIHDLEIRAFTTCKRKPEVHL